jgi:hypothetical protein
MNGLGDSVTIGIVLTLIFGAAFFYLYSRLSQNEKRVSLLENLLLNLKMSTEASLMGPDMVEPTSSPAPLEKEDVEEVSEVEYANMLKGIDADIDTKTSAVDSQGDAVSRPSASASATASASASATATASEEEAAPSSVRKMDANYESMSLKELQALARQRSISGVPSRKRELIDALKKQGEAPPSAPAPLPVAEDELEGANFKVDFLVQKDLDQASV